MEPEAFYDDLAPDYHLIFEDWERSIARQAAVLATLLGDAETVLDAACGIGTQALGLARAGFAVTASDVSAAAVARCAREAAARGLPIRTAVADLRTLDLGRFDAVVCMDNALPHLLTDEDLAAACASLHRSLVPGGLLLASTRDYDAAPTGDPPRRFADRTDRADLGVGGRRALRPAPSDRARRRGRRAPHALPGAASRDADGGAARSGLRRRRVAADGVPPAGRQRTNFVSGDSDVANAAMSRAHASMSESWTISTGECM